jgi:hypothetical protein
VNNPFDVKENDDHALDFALHLSHHFQSQFVWTFRVRLMHSYPNPCLIVVRVSVTLIPIFAQNLMLFLCRIHAESHQDRYTTANKRT